MSVPAPGGFSGGILSYAAAHRQATAVVTANVETSITVDSYEEVRTGDQTYKETIKRVISYGIALMLSGYREWLAEVCS